MPTEIARALIAQYRDFGPCASVGRHLAGMRHDGNQCAAVTPGIEHDNETETDMNGTTPTRQRATYGDFITLPSAPGVLWQVTDTRAVDKAGDPNETRAELRPFHPGPDLDAPAVGAHPYNYGEPVKIGKAERVGVYVGLAMVYPYDRATDTYGPTRVLRAYPKTGTFDDRLTDAQKIALRVDCEDAFGVAFVLPPLTPAEIVQRVTERVPDMGRIALTAALMVPGHSAVGFQNSQDDDVRAEIRAAFDSDEGRDALAALLEDAVVAFREAFATELARFGGES